MLRRHLYLYEKMVSVSGGKYGLTQPESAVLEAFHHQDFCISAMEEALAKYGVPDTFEYRSKEPVYKFCFDDFLSEQRGPLLRIIDRPCRCYMPALS
jgi:hypothetical protein